MAVCGAKDELLGPCALVIGHQAVLEKPQSLVGPDADQRLDRQLLLIADGFVDAPHPPREFAWAVHVMRLHIHSEPAQGPGGPRAKGRPSGNDDGACIDGVGGED